MSLECPLVEGKFKEPFKQKTDGCSRFYIYQLNIRHYKRKMNVFEKILVSAHTLLANFSSVN